MRIAVVLASAAVALLLAACGGGDAGGGDGAPRVLASTPLIADLASRVAGDDADVEAIVPAGADLHSFEPAPAVARRLAEADLVLVNGYRLEGALLDVIVENRRSDVPVVAVSRGLEPLAGDDHEEEGAATTPADGADNVDPLAFAEGDPHFWLDVSNAVVYVENIRDALSEVDPERASDYAMRAAQTIADLDALDAEVRADLEAIPGGRRNLVVFHDGYSYFAQAYGFELAAALIPAGANQEPSAREVSEVIETVRAEGIPAIYREPQFNPAAVEAVAAETGAQVLELLSTYTDEVDSYEELMRANVRALVEGLGGS